MELLPILIPHKVPTASLFENNDLSSDNVSDCTMDLQELQKFQSTFDYTYLDPIIRSSNLRETKRVTKKAWLCAAEPKVFCFKPVKQFQNILSLKPKFKPSQISLVAKRKTKNHKQNVSTPAIPDYFRFDSRLDYSRVSVQQNQENKLKNLRSHNAASLEKVLLPPFKPRAVRSRTIYEVNRESEDANVIKMRDGRVFKIPQII